MDRILKEAVDRLRPKGEDVWRQIVVEHTRNPQVTDCRASQRLLDELDENIERTKSEKAATDARALAAEQETNTERRHKEAQELQRWGLLIAALAVLAAWAAWWQAYREVLSAQVIRVEAQTFAEQAQLHSKAAADAVASMDRDMTAHKSWLKNQRSPAVALPPSASPVPQATPMPATPNP